MGSAIGWLIGKRLFGKVIGERGAQVIAYGALILSFAAFAALALYSIRKDAVKDDRAKIEARARPATDKAADERARDAIAAATNEKELHDAIAAQPDQPIAPTSRALGCKRLHNAGRYTAACPRPSGSDGTQARPD